MLGFTAWPDVSHLGPAAASAIEDGVRKNSGGFTAGFLVRSNTGGRRGLIGSPDGAVLDGSSSRVAKRSHGRSVAPDRSKQTIRAVPCRAVPMPEPKL